MPAAQQAEPGTVSARKRNGQAAVGRHQMGVGREGVSGHRVSGCWKERWVFDSRVHGKSLVAAQQMRWSRGTIAPFDSGLALFREAPSP